MLPTWAWRPTLAWVARGPLKVARECDPGMRQEFASENKPKTGSNASVSLTKRTQFNRGAGKSLNIVFSRGLRAARTGGVVAAIPFACHTVRRRQRKNLLPNNPPLGFSLGTVTTTETLSTEATPEHHRGCFNAPKFPLTPLTATAIADPKHIRHPRPPTRDPRRTPEPTKPSSPTPIPRHPRPPSRTRNPSVIPDHTPVIPCPHSPSFPALPKCHSERSRGIQAVHAQSPPSQTAPRPSSPTPTGDLLPHPSRPSQRRPRQKPQPIAPSFRRKPEPANPSFRRRPEPKGVGGMPHTRWAT